MKSFRLIVFSVDASAEASTRFSVYQLFIGRSCGVNYAWFHGPFAFVSLFW